MRKIGNIEYSIDLETSEVVFYHSNEEVRLPIEMGQSARGIIVAYMDKVHRGTRIITGRRKRSYEDHNVLVKLIELHQELSNEYLIRRSTLRVLKILVEKYSVDKELKEDVLRLVGVLVPKSYRIPKDSLNKLVNAHHNKDKRAYNSIQAILSDDINLFKTTRQEYKIMIADVYEKHKDKVIRPQDSKIVSPAKPMHNW